MRTRRSGSVRVTKHEAIKKRQQVIAGPYAARKPSEVTDTPWIYARRKVGTYPKATEQTGKWLIFTQVERLDETWAVIKDATESGQLGDSAKVATIYPNPLNRDPRSRVICVYTYDWTDEADVRRVRQTLRTLGFLQKLAYKADRDTLEGKYRSTGHTRISKFYE